MDNEILIDCNEMPESEFDEKFKEIVGCTWKEWVDRETTKYIGESEQYTWMDDNFIFGGTAYEHPKLYKNN